MNEIIELTFKIFIGSILFFNIGMLPVLAIVEIIINWNKKI